MGRNHSTLFNRELITANIAPTLDFEQQSLTASLAWSDFQGTELSPLIETVEHIAAKALAEGN